jgi:hypothetical protein
LACLSELAIHPSVSCDVSFVLVDRTEIAAETEVADVDLFRSIIEADILTRLAVVQLPDLKLLWYVA